MVNGDARTKRTLARKGVPRVASTRYDLTAGKYLLVEVKGFFLVKSCATRAYKADQEAPGEEGFVLCLQAC